MQTERRCVQRKRPGGISYFEFEAGSGGIVLDASEKGLRFQAAEAIQQVGPGRIWISPSPEERIELRGKVVWTDRTKKTGGLRFIEAQADNSRKLRKWLGQPDDSEVTPPSERFPLPDWATQAPSDLRQESRQDVSIPRSTAVPRAKTGREERPVELHSIPGLPSLFTSSVPWQTLEAPTSDRRIGYRIATGFLVIVLVMAGVVLFDMFRPKVGESLIHLGEKINGSTNLQPQNPSPQTSSSPVPAQPSPNGEAKIDTPDKNTGARDSALPLDFTKQVPSQRPDAAVPRKQHAPDRPVNRQSPSSERDRSLEATGLWSAVASGDFSAEVELARLYLRGEGVPRNCEQARVLLRAAAKGGSAEARQQLKKLRTRGCQ